MADILLEGIKVLDWTQFVAGPAVGCRLAALGADVIHVEQAGVGDGCRGTKAIQGINQILPNKTSAQYEYWNYNKRSFTIDLSKEKGREIMYCLVGKSDIFISNQVFRTVENFAMNYETLSKYNPKLIYVHISIMGPKGPYRNVPGWDTLGQAVSGIMTTSGARGQPPVQATLGISDHASEMAAEIGIFAALYHREHTGKGQKIETSQLQASMNGLAASCLGNYLMMHDGIVRANPRQEEPNPLFNIYRCKDNKWIILGSASERYWPILVETIDRSDLMEDKRFVNLEKREENCRELIAILDQIFSQKTAEEWQKKFNEVNFPFSFINQLSDLPNNPQVVANDYLFTFTHPALGKTQYPGMTFTLNENPAIIRTGAPEFGQHTEEILLEVGYSWEEIERFHVEEVI